MLLLPFVSLCFAGPFLRSLHCAKVLLEEDTDTGFHGNYPAELLGVAALVPLVPRRGRLQLHGEDDDFPCEGLRCLGLWLCPVDPGAETAAAVIFCIQQH